MQTTLTPNEAAAAGGVVGGVLGGMFAVVAVFAIVWIVLAIIAGWKIFEKAGEKGWKILIPIYDAYIMYKIVGMKMWFWITLAVSVIVSVVISAMGFDTNTMTADSFSGDTLVPALLYVAEMIFMFVIIVVMYARLSKVFGHGVGFTLGLIFLSGIFMLILGFDKSKYDKKLAATWEKK